MKHFFTYRDQSLHNNATVTIKGQDVALAQVNSFSEDESSDYDREFAVVQSIRIDNKQVVGTWLDEASSPKKEKSK